MPPRRKAKPKAKSKPWYIRTKADEKAIEAGYYYEAGRGEMVCAFVEKFCRITKGRKAGQAFTLLDWQKEIVLLLYNWKRPDGTRRFRNVYVEIPKKNGKSTLLAPLIIAEALLGEVRGQHYLCAGTGEQALIIYDEIVAIITGSELLSQEFEPKEYYSLITCHRTGTFIKALSGDPEKAANKDGFDASFVVFDELHRQRNYKLWDVFKYAGAARAEPIKFAITTAGDRRSGICWEQHEKAVAILKGENDWDIEHLAIVHAANPDDDIEDPEVWKRANPSLGVTLSLQDFRQEYIDAKQLPRTLNEFKRLRLNIWTEGDSAWLPMDRWAEAKEEIDLDSLYGERCWIGVDLSTRIDLTALVVIFPHEDGNFTAIPHFWVPAECVDRREDLDHVPYRTWAQQKFLNLCPGDSISHEDILSKIKELCMIFDVEAILFDPWQARLIIEQLRNEGLPAQEFGQSFSNYDFPCKALEAFILERKIRHSGNPILTWNLASAVVKNSDNGGIRLDRKRKKGRDDGAAALIMALGGALSAEARKGLYTDARIIRI